MRLFLALDLPAAVKSALDQVRGSFQPDRSIRWVRPENLHITLRFLGEGGAEGVEPLRAALVSAPLSSAFDLSILGVGTFGGARARVIWAGVRGDVPALHALQQSVELACRAAGWPPDDKAYKPHVTLGRSRDKRGVPVMSPPLSVLLAAYSEADFGAVRADAVVLYRSVTAAGGAVYEPVFRLRVEV